MSSLRERHQAQKGRPANDTYVLGHSGLELIRLRKQAAVYADFTRDVLRCAGLRPGMAVLDIGCGVGDVTFAAARIVAPSGSVCGIDLSQEALNVARARVPELDNPCVRFAQVGIDDLDDSLYDAVVGRFILLHRSDPAATLRSILDSLRPGGVAAFIEMDLSTAEVVPPLPLFADALRWIREVYGREGFHTDMGSGLYKAFRASGLEPDLAATVRVEGGPDAYAFDYVAETVRSLLPRIVALGVATAAEVSVDTLADRIRTAALEGSHCFFYPRMIGAFARKPM